MYTKCKVNMNARSWWCFFVASETSKTPLDLFEAVDRGGDDSSDAACATCPKNWRLLQGLIHCTVCCRASGMPVVSPHLPGDDVLTELK
jgi:hypothetical protein